MDFSFAAVTAAAAGQHVIKFAFGDVEHNSAADEIAGAGLVGITAAEQPGVGIVGAVVGDAVEVEGDPAADFRVTGRRVGRQVVIAAVHQPRQ